MSHQVSPHVSRAGGTLKHALECFLDIRGGAVRQARDDGPTGKDVGIGCEHDGGHGASGRQPRNVDATGVDTVIERHSVDHLPYRESLTLSPLRVAGLKPVEAAVRVV